MYKILINKLTFVLLFVVRVYLAVIGRYVGATDDFVIGHWTAGMKLKG